MGKYYIAGMSRGDEVVWGDTVRLTKKQAVEDAVRMCRRGFVPVVEWWDRHDGKYPSCRDCVLGSEVVKKKGGGRGKDVRGGEGGLGRERLVRGGRVSDSVQDPQGGFRRGARARG